MASLGGFFRPSGTVRDGVRLLPRISAQRSPASSTEVNTERLPAASLLDSMSLRYLATIPLDAASQQQLLKRTFRSSRAIAILLTIGLLTGPVIPSYWAIPLTFLGSVLWAAVLFVYRVRDKDRLRRILLWPNAFVIGAAVLTSLLEKFGRGPFLFPAIVALALHALWLAYGHGPFAVYRAWLYAHPALGPRRQFRADVSLVRYAVNTSTFLLGIAVIHAAVALNTPPVGIEELLFTMGIAALFVGVPSIAFVSPTLLNALQVATKYDGRETGAPGVWRAPGRPAERRLFLKAGFGTLVIALALGWGFLPPDAKEAPRHATSLESAVLDSVNPYSGVRAFMAPVDTGIILGLMDSDSMGATDAESVALATRTLRNVARALSATAFTLMVALPLGLVALVLSLVPLVPQVWLLRSMEKERDKIAASETSPVWEHFVDRLQTSEHVAPDPASGEPIREQDHLFLGIEPHQDFPVLLHRPLLSEHCYISGDSGSGKTSLGIMPLLIQLLRGGQRPPVVILDLKGDPALFHLARTEAESAGQDFLFFTPEKDRASYRFNPFPNFQSDYRTLTQLCHLFLDALSLNHGDGYGRSYFSLRARDLLYSIIDEHNPQSFKELYEHLEKVKNKKGNEDAFQLVGTIHALSTYPGLDSFKPSGAQGSGPDTMAIHMPTVLEKGQVVYFWLPAVVESVSAREIGKLAVYSLLTAAIDAQRRSTEATEEGTSPKQSYLFVDEFQRLAADNFRIVLEQARSLGVSAVLSNQSISDLNTADIDLRPTVRANTRVKMYFTVSDLDEMQRLSTLSGQDLTEERATTTSYSYSLRGFGPSGSGETRREVLTPRLTVADIQRYSDASTDLILHVTRGSGYTQFAGLPVPVRTTWPITYERYQRLKACPWPTLARDTSGAPIQNDSVEPRDRDREARAEAERRLAARREQMEVIWSRAADGDAPDL